jgi:tetratricopeptide (TPR) repeat protein
MVRKLLLLKLSSVDNNKSRKEHPMNGSDEGRELCARAAELRQEWQAEENLVKAEDLFREAVQKFPDLWTSHFGLGEILVLKAGRSQISSGPPLDEGRQELKKAVALDPAQPEPLLKLANTLAETDIAAAEGFYEQALEALQGQAEGLYSVDWQSGDHWQFAIGAAENGRDSIAVDAFCRAIEMNYNYSGMYMPSTDRANAVWQSALRKLGRTEWFDQQKEHEDLFGDLVSESEKKWWQFWK